MKAKTKSAVRIRASFDPAWIPLAFRYCQRHGGTDRDICTLLAIPPNSLRTWMRRNPEFKQAIQDGRDEYNVRKIERSLLQIALGYEYDEVTIRETVIKQGKGRKAIELPAIERTVTHKRVPPNSTAIMFALQNRAPGRWKNVKFIENSVHVDGEVKYTDRKELAIDLKGLTLDELHLLRPIIEKQANEAQNRRLLAGQSVEAPTATTAGQR